MHIHHMNSCTEVFARNAVRAVCMVEDTGVISATEKRDFLKRRFLIFLQIW